MRRPTLISNVLIGAGALLLALAITGYANLSFRQALLKKNWDAPTAAAPAVEATRPAATPSREAASSTGVAFSEGQPVARLRIPGIELDAVVLEGMSDATLSIAPGHYPGMSQPGEGGHAVLAAHRDSFFKDLGDLRPGDTISLTRWDGRDVDYRVSRSYIVHKSNRTVIVPRSEDVLTLITCYPFVYAGRAPYRYIVEARPAPELAGA